MVGVWAVEFSRGVVEVENRARTAYTGRPGGWRSSTESLELFISRSKDYGGRATAAVHQISKLQAEMGDIAVANSSLR